MLSEEEKAHIIEKMKFENDIRQKLSEGENFSWQTLLSQKFSLLIIGFLLTGVLGTWFQHRHRMIEWKGQNRYNKINFKLGMMRESLKEFASLSPFTAEAYERVAPFVDSATLTRRDYEEFEREYIELQNRRFRQNDKVSSLIRVSFRDTEALEKPFRDYAIKSSIYLKDLRTFMHLKYCVSNPTQCEQTDLKGESLDKLRINIRNSTTVLNGYYLLVIDTMTQEIGRAEDESEKWL